MSRERFSAVVAAALIAALYGLLIFAPPDGRERASLAQFLGGMHPLAVHLPIALILLVPVLELAGRRAAHLRDAAGFVLGLALAAAIVTPALGWLLAWSGGFEGALLTHHMWGGVSFAVLCWACWVLRARRVPYALSLTAAVALVAWTGYRGGQLAHGEDHLTRHMPSALRASLGMPPVEGESVAHGDSATFYGARVVPILEEHCVLCHGANKRKGGLRLNTYAALLKGGNDGPIVVPGDAAASELVRRIKLPAGSEGAMPAEGKPPLPADDVKLIELWVAAGASQTTAVAAIRGAPGPAAPMEALAPDYRPRLGQVAALERSLGVRLVPRSQNPTDGLVLRTVTVPDRATDAAIAGLAPVSELIVDAELARTPLTDAALGSIARFTNLRSLDLSHTRISAAGLRSLTPLKKLETLNLTGTGANEAAVAPLLSSALKRVYLFEAGAQHPPTRAHPST
jgi:uncharacterized membrane protein/mono/diheme cytochrome c family protein